MTTRPRLGLTAWLTLLVLGAVVPLLIFGGLTLRGILHTSRALADRGQVDTTRALALAVDGEVRSWRAALLALADSRSLRPGRWAEFYEEARAVAAQYEGWVVLHRATGPQQLNTLRPFGVPLPQTAAPDLVQAVFRDGKPVTDMAFGAVAQRYVISTSVPVFRNGKVAFCLSLNFGPERLSRLLQSQQVPPTWVAAINDSHRRVVARSRDAEARVGKPVVEWLAAATRAAESGILAGPMIDGRLGQIAFHRLQEAPWVAVLAIPVAELQSAAPIWGFTLVGGILGLAAVGMAVFMGRKVTAPVRSLARASEGLLRGEVADLRTQTDIREVQELQHALIDASTGARVNAEERERAAEALRQANEALEARVLERTAALASANEALRAAIADLQEEIAQRRRAEEEVRALARFPSENPNPILRLSAEGRVLYANAASAALLRQWGSAVGSPVPAPWPATVRDALTSQSATAVELACGDRTFSVFVAPVPEAGYVNLYTRDITERKRAEQEREATVNLLRLVNESKDLRELVGAVVTFFRQQSGCEAVGVRLREGEDYPYYQTQGFPEEFVLLENHLCARDPAGQVLRDSAGYPIIECMCGNVICGRFDPAMPFFTAKGSFWTNNTTELLATSNEAERQARTRNRCNGEGYESVALIAMRLGEERLGLLQLNDRRKGMFSAQTIAQWERLAGYLAVALAKLRADEALQASQQRNEFLADVLKSANQPFAVGYPDGRLGLMNQAFEQLTGYEADELHSIEWITALTPPEWRELERQKLEDLHRSGQPVRYEKEYVRKDGTRVPIELLVHLVRDAEGKPEYYYSFLTDITKRKRAEERLRSSLREKEVLLKEIHHRVKNNLQVISSLVSLQADGLGDPSLRDLFRDMQDRIRSMALVHEKLYQSESLASRVEFSDYAGSLLNYLWRTHGAAAARVRLTLKLERLPLSVETAVPCGLILNELAANALKHAFPARDAGEVTAVLHADPGGRVHLCVRDDGVGLPPGMDWRHTRSLGLQLVQMLTSQINGTVEVRSGAGTEFEITFTLPAAHGQAGEQTQPRGEGKP